MDLRPPSTTATPDAAGRALLIRSQELHTLSSATEIPLHRLPLRVLAVDGIYPEQKIRRLPGQGRSRNCPDASPPLCCPTCCRCTRLLPNTRSICPASTRFQYNDAPGAHHWRWSRSTYLR